MVGFHLGLSVIKISVLESKQRTFQKDNKFAHLRDVETINHQKLNSKKMRTHTIIPLPEPTKFILAGPKPKLQKNSVLPSRRKKPVNIKITCSGNNRIKCQLKASVRDESIAFSTTAPDGWPHISQRDALRLAEWLVFAVGEIRIRKIYVV